MSYILSACQKIAEYFRPGTLAVLESTTYPGTTEEVVLPILSSSGMCVGRDFFLCFSPERVDTGEPNIPDAEYSEGRRGSDPACTENRDSSLCASSTKGCAGKFDQWEMVKLLENLSDDQHWFGERACGNV